MGKVQDWSKVFESIEQMDFECVMSFLPYEEREKSEEYEWGKRNKAEELFESKRESEKWAGVTLFDKGRSLLEEKEAESDCVREYAKMLFEKEIEEAFEESLILGKILPEEEKEYEVFSFLPGEEKEYEVLSFLPDERNVYQKEEKTLHFYEEAREKVKPLDNTKRNDVIKSVRQDEKESRVQIEMKKREVPYQDVDMDRIEEMLTQRLCDMMQKSVEGYYI